MRGVFLEKERVLPALARQLTSQAIMEEYHDEHIYIRPAFPGRSGHKEFHASKLISD